MQLSHDAAAATSSVEVRSGPSGQQIAQARRPCLQLDVGAFNGVDSKILNMHPHVDLVHLGHLSCRILLHG